MCIRDNNRVLQTTVAVTLVDILNDITSKILDYHGCPPFINIGGTCPPIPYGSTPLATVLLSGDSQRLTVRVSTTVNTVSNTHVHCKDTASQICTDSRFFVLNSIFLAVTDNSAFCVYLLRASVHASSHSLVTYAVC